MCCQDTFCLDSVKTDLDSWSVLRSWSNTPIEWSGKSRVLWWCSQQHVHAVVNRNTNMLVSTTLDQQQFWACFLLYEVRNYLKALIPISACMGTWGKELNWALAIMVICCISCNQWCSGYNDTAQGVDIPPRKEVRFGDGRREKATYADVLRKKAT
jgi:hypothetical protein